MMHVYAIIGTIPNFPYTKYMYGCLERPHKSGKRSCPYMNKLFKIQCSIIPINPALLAFGHRFKGGKYEDKKMLTRGSAVTCAETRESSITFVVGLTLLCYVVVEIEIYCIHYYRQFRKGYSFLN